MRQEYKKPTVEIISFDNSDIICASGDLPQIEQLTKDGISLGNKAFSEVMVPTEQQ